MLSKRSSNGRGHFPGDILCMLHDESRYTSVATNMATRVLRKVLQGRVGTLILCPTDCRRYIIPGVRYLCSTVRDAREDFHPSLPFPERVKNIRPFCETLSAPNEVLEMFNQFIILPEQHMIKALDYSLNCLVHYDKIDAAFELKTLMEQLNIPKSHSTYSVLANLYSKSNHPKHSMKSLFDEMLKDGLTPRARHFKPFVEMEANKGDPMDAFRCLDDLRHSGVLHERIVDIYITVVRACVGKVSKQLKNKVLELFYDIRRYRDLLSIEALETIKLWFDSLKDPKWVTAWSSPSATYHCQACKQKLETGNFTEEELHELKDPLISHVLRNRKVLSEVRCHTTAGKYVDYIRPGHSNRFPNSVVRFIETTGHYDVVLDGLNLAYYYHHFDAKKLKAVAEHFLKQKKRVLVVGSWPISLGHIRRHDQNSLPSVMDFLRVHCGVFCLAARALDDVYLLSAAMQCGPGTLLVSSDMFSNHLQGMESLMKAQFTRWQELYQVKLASFVGEQPLFESVRRFDRRVHVQTTGDTWHFPSSDGSKWLCVRREDQSL